MRQKTTKMARAIQIFFVEICATGDRYLFALFAFKRSFFEESKKRQKATKNDKK